MQGCKGTSVAFGPVGRRGQETCDSIRMKKESELDLFNYIRESTLPITFIFVVNGLLVRGIGSDPDYASPPDYILVDVFHVCISGNWLSLDERGASIRVRDIALWSAN